MILLIDNFDSFAHNLARYFRRLDQEVEVVRNNAIDVAAIHRLRPQAIVLSPGPCTPDQAGCSLEVVRQFYTKLPILGICLGHQTIVAALGGHVVRAPRPMHGRTSSIRLESSGVFANIPSPLTVCRYHSLVAEEASLPAGLRVTARTDDHVIMAVEHVEHPVVGLQFHPEAALTRFGFSLLANFLKLAGIETTAEVASLASSEVLRVVEPHESTRHLPVTF